MKMSGIRIHGGKLPDDLPLHLLFPEPQARDAGYTAITSSDIALGAAIGHAVEGFHFLVFALAAVLVFPALFFPFAAQPQGTLYAFLVLALAWMAGPLGRDLFLPVRQRFGRTARMVAAFILLGVTTAGVAFLPGYHAMGFTAIAWLALLRIGQGIAFGGAWERTPALPQWYWHPMLGRIAGFALAGGLFAGLSCNLTQAEFQTWGWRFPFFIALAIDLVALFARIRLAPATQKHYGV